MNDKLLTIREAMEMLNVKSLTTIYKFIKKDKTLPATKVGKSYRIKLSDIQKFIDDGI